MRSTFSRVTRVLLAGMLVGSVTGFVPAAYGAPSSARVSSGTPRLAASPTAPGRVLVKFKSGTPGWKRSAQAALAGGALDSRHPGLAKLGWSVVEPQVGESAASVLLRVAASGTADAVEFDGVATLADTVPNDPEFGKLWGLNNTGQSVMGTTGIPGADISAEQAWSVSTGSHDTIVAVVDEGVDFGHPDLAANKWVNPNEIAGNGIDDDHDGYVDDMNGWDWVNNDATVFDSSDNEQHATHVAGTIGAVGDNGVGVVGVNWHVQIMSLKFISGLSGNGYISDAAEAIMFATDHGATAINHSWTTGGPDAALNSAIAYSAAHGVLNLCAAGNETVDNDSVPSFPASSPATNVVSVASTTNRDALSSFSNYGVASVDLAAPGSYIYSTAPFSLVAGGYQYMSGTSMATPHVTGAVALLHSAFPTESGADLRRRMEDTVDPLASLAGKVATGGRLNIGAAVGNYAPAPAITSPVPGDVLSAGALATIAFEPHPGTAPAATFAAQVGLPTEYLSGGGFESGSMSGWTTTGSLPTFHVTSTPGQAHLGTYGVVSGGITDSQYTAISRSVTLAQAGEISFWYWQDSEDMWDYGYFQVDGSTRWRAEIDAPWTWVVLPLEAGTHTITFGYYKDINTSEGLDAFGLDDICVATYAWTDASPVVPGSNEATFTVPSYPTTNAEVRVRAELDGVPSSWETVGNIELTGDAVPPGPVTSLAAVRNGDDIDLTWTNPADADFAMTRVLARLGTPPTGPDDSSAELVYEGAGQSAAHVGAYDGTVEGEMYYAAYAYDTSGNHAAADTTSITIDVVGPYGTFRLDGGAAYTATTTVSADSAMNEATEMAFDVPGSPAGEWMPFAAHATLVLPGEGTQTVGARYRDIHANVSTRSASIYVDLTAPEATVSGIPAEGTWSTSPVTVTLDGSDGGSGLAALRYTLGGVTSTYTAPFAAPEGSNVLTYWAVDKAGNESAPTDVTIQVDTIAPSAPAAPLVDGAGKGWLHVSSAVLPATGDVGFYTLYRKQLPSGSPVTVGTFAPGDSIDLLQTGLTDGVRYAYTLKATDVHGNLSVASAQAIGTPGVEVAAAAGDSRYSTAMIAALDGFDTAPTALIATGEDYADALGASALAGAYDGPVLLTMRDSLPAGLLTTLGTLKTKDVIIVGGTGAVSSAVESQLKGSLGSTHVRRVYGSDRYSTAAAVAAATLAKRGSDHATDAVFVVRGTEYADALAVAPVAYAAHAPILLVAPTGAGGATLSAIDSGGYASVVVVGGTSAVPNSVASSLGLPWTRVAGTTRYDTARRFAEWANTEGLASFGTVGLATGENFPDALGGGAVVGHESGVLLLTRTASLSPEAASAISGHAAEVSMLRIFGGTGAVSTTARDAAAALLGR